MITTCPLARADVMTQHLADGSVVLFDPVMSTAHELNVTAALVWDCCDGLHSFDQIVEVVEECFSRSHPCRQDVSYFLEGLRQLQLLATPEWA